MMTCNPVTYGVAALRHGLYWNDALATAELPSKAVALGVTTAFAVVMMVLALVAARRVTAADLQ